MEKRDILDEIQRCFSIAPLPELVSVTLTRCHDEIMRLRSAHEATRPQVDWDARDVMEKDFWKRADDPEPRS